MNLGQRRSASATPGGSAATTRTPTSASRRCSRSPTGWAARRQARSRPSWRRARSRAAQTRPAAERSASSSSIQEANRRVFERAREDAALAGMGTTMTRRARRGRQGRARPRRRLARLPAPRRQLEQLTEDHSLVAELVARGKLSAGGGRDHPQRSVITRALGTDPDVDVDAFTVETQDGDVFLLCSDGLTAMVERRAIQRDPREAAAATWSGPRRTLVEAANKGGGEDNITVVLFEIGGRRRATDGDGRCPSESEDDDEDTLSELDGVPSSRPGRRVVRRTATSRADRRPRPPRGAAPHWIIARHRPSPSSASSFGLSQSHFVGAQKDGHVAVYQGLPYDIAGSPPVPHGTSAACLPRS